MNIGLCMASGINECLDFMQKINAEIRKANKSQKKLSNFPLNQEKLKKKEEKTSTILYWDRLRYIYHGKFHFTVDKKCVFQVLTDIFPYSKQNLQVISFISLKDP